MIRLFWDECASEHALVALRQRIPGIDIVTARDTGLAQSRDSDIAEWCGNAGRVIVSSDRSTMMPAVWERIRTGRRTAGLIILDLRACSPGDAVDDLVLIVTSLTSDEMRDRGVIFVPLR